MLYRLFITKCRHSTTRNTKRAIFRYPPVGNEGGGANAAREFIHRMEFRQDPYRTWKGHNQSMVDMLHYGDYENAMDYFDTLKRHGPAPDAETYNLAFEAFHLAGTPFNVLSQYQNMLDRGMTPNQSTITWVVSTYCYLRQMDNAIKVLNSTSAFNFEPAIRSYCAIIEAYTKDSKFDEAWKWINTTASIHDVPIQLNSEKPAGDVEFYNILLLYYALSKQVNEAEELFTSLLQRGDVRPTVNTFLRLIEGYTGNAVDLKTCKYYGGKIADLLEHLLMRTYRGDPTKEYRIRWVALDALAKTSSGRIQEVLNHVYPCQPFNNSTWGRIAERARPSVEEVGDSLDPQLRETVPNFDELPDDEKYELRFMEYMAMLNDRPMPAGGELYQLNRMLHYESLDSLEKVEKEEEIIRRRNEEKQKAKIEGREYVDPTQPRRTREHEGRTREHEGRTREHEGGVKFDEEFDPEGPISDLQERDQEEADEVYDEDDVKAKEKKEITAKSKNFVDFMFRLKARTKPKFRKEFGGQYFPRETYIEHRPHIKFKNTEIEIEDAALDPKEQELDKTLTDTDIRTDFILSQPPSERELYLRQQYVEATTHPVELHEKMTKEESRNKKLSALLINHGQYYPELFTKLQNEEHKKWKEDEKLDYAALYYEQTGVLIPPEGLTNKQTKLFYDNLARIERRKRQVKKEMEKLKQTNPELYQRLVDTCDDEVLSENKRIDPPTDEELDIQSMVKNPVKGIAKQVKAAEYVELELEREITGGSFRGQVEISGADGSHPIAAMALHRLNRLAQEQTINPKFRRDF